MEKNKKKATIQVDLDSFQIIAENSGIEINQVDIDSFYNLSLSRFLKLFNSFDVKATFFVIGKDIKNKNNQNLLKQAVAQGHEIGNHTMNHIIKKPFSSLSYQEQIKEIKLCHKIIYESVGIYPVGFKSPAYSVIPLATSEFLKRNGYLYDSSAMPVSIKSLLNIFCSIFNKRVGKTYWNSSDNVLNISDFFQVPVSTIPVLQIPFNSTFVFTLGKFFFDWGFSLKVKHKSTLNYLFHGIDLVKRKEMPSKFLKLIEINHHFRKKEKICKYILSQISNNYHILPTRELINFI